MTNRLGQILVKAADDHLNQTDVLSPRSEISRPGEQSHRGAFWVLSAAAVLIVVVGFAALLTLGNGRQRVETPADLARPITTAPVDSASEAVQHAIETTLASSFVATSTFSETTPPNPALIVYNPPESTLGRPYSALSFKLREGGEQLVGLSSSPRVLVACSPSDDAPCRQGAWFEQSGSEGGTADASRIRFDAETLGLGAVTPTGAPPPAPRQGAFAVEATDLCGGKSCTGTLTVEDGFVTRLELATKEGTFMWTYGSFGKAPAVLEPSAEDTVAVDESLTTLCDVTVQVDSSADPARVRAQLSDWVEANGRRVPASALSSFADSADGVLSVKYSYVEGCERDPVSITIKTP